MVVIGKEQYELMKYLREREIKILEKAIEFNDEKEIGHFMKVAKSRIMKKTGTERR